MLDASSQVLPRELTATLYVDAAMHEIVPAIAACGVSPIVRIAANEGWMVKRMLLDASPSSITVI